jgi:carboxypeptidase C (cathepsin A)
MTLFKRSLLASAALATALCLGPASAQELELGLTAETAHEGDFHGQHVAYDALVETYLLPGADGETAGRLVTTSYIARDAGDAAERPVLFLFNGGPGASTTPLHLSAFGPMRRFGEGEAAFMQPNPDSLLDAADLVFIDPVGTGFSIPETEEDGARFWSREGDARSVASVIANWLERHERAASPRYVLGQSYGTLRAAEIARLAPELELDGILLFALVPDSQEGDEAYALSFPSMAAAARYHERTDREGQSATEVFEEAVDYARSTYLPALVHGEALSAEEKAGIADDLSGFTGLPAAYVLEHDIRLSNDAFMFELLADEGLRTGQLDARATRSLDAPAQRPPYDDPGLSYHPGEATEPEGEPAFSFDAEAYPSIVEAYYDEVLGFDPEGPYRALNLDVNAAWDHQGFQPAIPYLATAMEGDPELRLFWAAGIFDLSTPAFGGRYTLDQAGIPADRLTAAYFPAGHSVFVGEENRALLGEAVRAFLNPQD